MPISGTPHAGASACSQSRSTATAQRLKPKPAVELSIHEYLQLLLLQLCCCCCCWLPLAIFCHFQKASPTALKSQDKWISVTKSVLPASPSASSSHELSPLFLPPSPLYHNQLASATNVKTTAAAVAASRQQLKSYLMLQSPAFPLPPSHSTLFPIRLSPFFAFVAAVGNHGKLSSVGIS